MTCQRLFRSVVLAGVVLCPAACASGEVYAPSVTPQSPRMTYDGDEYVSLAVVRVSAPNARVARRKLRKACAALGGMTLMRERIRQ